MKVVLNGETLEIGACTLAELLREQGYETADVVVEHNLEVIGNKRWHEVDLNPGDAVEVIRFVGGG
jgi:thiamine biosynthesis protein ThiS